MIASNEPGSVDSLVIAAHAGRPDHKIIPCDIRFLEQLPNISRYMLYAPYDNAQARMQVVRQESRYLEGGGAPLLLLKRESTPPEPSCCWRVRS